MSEYKLLEQHRTDPTPTVWENELIRERINYRIACGC